jgi:hypothetical protein
MLVALVLVFLIKHFDDCDEPKILGLFARAPARAKRPLSPRARNPG